MGKEIRVNIRTARVIAIRTARAMAILVVHGAARRVVHGVAIRGDHGEIGKVGKGKAKDFLPDFSWDAVEEGRFALGIWRHRQEPRVQQGWIGCHVVLDCDGGDEWWVLKSISIVKL